MYELNKNFYEKREKGAYQSKHLKNVAQSVFSVVNILVLFLKAELYLTCSYVALFGPCV